ncbi:hypothetical protein Nepgr_005748 [Nepenthes gracilis]|uniref:Uncharacterized protein n=1 Tax=Nepenthes gracilis TaxID=150966 RepID=A0AAD3S446_NEPGR|nr:hypothetical protein Nepgr_005748 [Nepenthes gracilis]
MNVAGFARVFSNGVEIKNNMFTFCVAMLMELGDAFWVLFLLPFLSSKIGYGLGRHIIGFLFSLWAEILSVFKGVVVACSNVKAKYMTDKKTPGLYGAVFQMTILHMEMVLWGRNWFIVESEVYGVEIENHLDGSHQKF